MNSLLSLNLRAIAWVTVEFSSEVKSESWLLKIQALVIKYYRHGLRKDRYHEVIHLEYGKICNLHVEKTAVGI
jgi:hypothetical protein